MLKLIQNEAEKSRIRRGRGRPEGSGQFTKLVKGYLNEEQFRLFAAICAQRGMSHSAILRDLVEDEARRRGLCGPTDVEIAAKAAELAEYYRTDPDVAAWDRVQDLHEE